MSQEDDRFPATAAEAALRAEIDRVGRRSERRFDPGMRAVLIAVAVLVLMVAATLPWAGGDIGWNLLFGQGDQQKVAGIAPRAFLGVALAFGVIGSMAALIIRRYGAAWVCSLGSDLSVLFGALSVWSLQTSSSHQPGPGPGPGLVLAVLAVLALAILWAGIAWRKPRLPAPPPESGGDGSPAAR